MSEGIIYTITDVVSRRVYVGSSISVRRRWALHESRLRAGKHHCRILQRTWNKRGSEAIRFDIVEVGIEPIFLAAREQFWMWRNNGYLMNSVAAVNSYIPRLQTESESERRSAAQKRRVDKRIDFTLQVRAKMSAARRARIMKPVSDETRRKISEKNKGRPRTSSQLEATRLYHESILQQIRIEVTPLIKAGKGFREIERITGRCRKVVARIARES